MHEGIAFEIGITFETICCYKCKMLFAVDSDVRAKWLSTGESFYCPKGHSQHYAESKEQKLEKEKMRLQRDLESEQQRSWEFEQEAMEERKKYNKIRARVVAGQCPCCEEIIPNLVEHMRTKHPEEGFLRQLRESVGLTQAQLAAETGTNQTYISKMENKKPVPGWVEQSVQSWLENLND